MATRGRPRKAKPAEEVKVSETDGTLSANEELEDALLAEMTLGESAVESPSKPEEPERWWKRNKYDDAINLARVLIKAQGKIHGDTANVVAQLVNDLDEKFPEL